MSKRKADPFNSLDLELKNYEQELAKLVTILLPSV
jgi:hypothetical protein